LFSACAAAGFYRRSALVSVGLFDDYLGAYYDDVDVGFRLQLAGYEVGYAPASICHHEGNASYRERSFGVWYHTSRNSEIVFWSNMPSKFLLRHSLAHILFSLLQVGPMIRRHEFCAYILGKLSALGFLSSILEKREFNRHLTRRSLDELKNRLVQDWVKAHCSNGKDPLHMR
jgi:GT2 family glycosyltransferase